MNEINSRSLEEGDFLKRAKSYFKKNERVRHYYEEKISFIAFKTAIGSADHDIIVCKLDHQTSPSIYYQGAMPAHSGL